MKKAFHGSGVGTAHWFGSDVLKLLGSLARQPGDQPMIAQLAFGLSQTPKASYGFQGKRQERRTRIR